MHMSDALLSPAVGAAMYAVSAAAIVYSAVRIKRDGIDAKKAAVAGVAGAFILAAQAVNYAIPGTGSSGHLIGAVMLTALVGAAPAMIVMALALTIQCLAFGDGGLLALGANIFNVGVIPCLIVYPLIFKPLMAKGVSAARTAFVSIISAVAALQFGACGVVLMTQVSGITALPFTSFALAMQPIHLIIGLIEGAATAVILCLVYKARPEIIASALDGEAIGSGVRIRRVAAAFAAVALILGFVMPRFGSDAPDGLEWSIERVTESAAVEIHESVIDG